LTAASELSACPSWSVQEAAEEGDGSGEAGAFGGRQPARDRVREALVARASTRIGGRDLSPALAWTPAPNGTAQLLLVIEDPDAPTPKPFVHCVALLEPSVTGLGQGALDGAGPATGVRVLRSGMGRGYMGPAPIKGHGPHRYVFQLFALGTPVTAAARGAALDDAKPRDVLAAAGHVLARGRFDGFYERP
jgi:phosphatidylethanolamine-binding protein (PEBP) family uncharacterized protein